MPKKSSKPSAIVVKPQAELAHVHRLIAPPLDAMLHAADVACSHVEDEAARYATGLVSRLFQCGARITEIQTQAAASVNAALSS